MRFLLNPARRSTSKAKALRGDNPKQLSPVVADNNSSSKNSTEYWGQQCSPSCGCVVRFETRTDPATGIITDAKYHAKSVVTVSKNNQLHPVLTTRTNRPMLKECKCSSVHTLSKEITHYIQNKSLHEIRDMSQFSFTRSSSAFRHAVMVQHQLPRQKTHCFDVVEEAFTAMIKGYIPSPRREKRCFQTLLAAEFVYHEPQPDDEPDLFPGRRGELPSLSMSTPQTMSALRAFDLNMESYENDKDPIYALESERKKSFDWLSFVDEQYRLEETAAAQ